MNLAALNVDTIFWEASQLPPGDEREGYLDRACGADLELRRRVEHLLRVQPKVAGLIERPFAGLAPSCRWCANRPAASSAPTSC